MKGDREKESQTKRKSDRQRGEREREKVNAVSKRYAIQMKRSAIRDNLWQVQVKGIK